jgi:hypothetical protein
LTGLETGVARRGQTAIAKLAPHLTMENREGLLARAAHKTKREIEELIAEVAPRPDAPALMRRLPRRATGLRLDGAVPSNPARRPDGLPSPSAELRLDGVLPPELGLRPNGVVSLEPGRGPAGSGPMAGAPGLRLDAVDEAEGPLRPSHGMALASAATVQPLAPGRYKVQFTASTELRDKLERLRRLMRSSVPDGDLAAIVEAAVTEKLERLEAAASPARSLPANASPRAKRAPPRATSRPPSAGPCTSGTEAAADSWMSKAAAARPATGSSSTIVTPSPWAATTPRTESPFSAGRTTSTWRRSTTAAGPCPPIGGRAPRRQGSSYRPERQTRQDRTSPTVDARSGGEGLHPPNARAGAWSRGGQRPPHPQVAGTSLGLPT